MTPKPSPSRKRYPRSATVTIAHRVRRRRGRPAGDRHSADFESLRLYTETSDMLAREQHLNEVTRIISSTLDLPTILSNIVRLAAELVGADAGSLGLISADGDYIENSYDFNLPNGLTLPPLPKGSGLAWHIIETEEPILLADYPSHPDALQIWIDAGVRAFIGVPVSAGDRQLGALGLFSLGLAKQFTVRELALAQSISRQAGAAIQNARLFEAEQQRVAALTALHEIGLDLSLQIDHNVLLQTIVERAVQRSDARMGALYLLMSDGKTLELISNYNFDPRYIGVQLKPGEGLSGKVAQTGEPMIVQDYAQWEGRSATFEARLFRSVLGVPIKWQSRVIGVLNISDDRLRRFTQFDVTLAGLFADQAAAAVFNSRLQAETQSQTWELARQLQELTVLNELAAATTEAIDEDFLITRVTDIVGKALYPDNFGIMLVDRNTGTVRPHLSYRGKHRKVKLGVGVVGRVAATGLPWLVSDVSAEPEYVDAEPQTQSELCVPVKIGDQVIGVVNAERAEKSAFTAADEQILFTIARQLATAIEKLRLLAAERVAHEQSEALYQVARTLNTSLDREQLLNSILDQLARVVAYDSASIMVIEDVSLPIVASRGFRTPNQLSQPLKIDSVRHIKEAIERRAPIMIPDTYTDPRWRRYPNADYIRCWLGVPLIVQDRVIGVLNLDKEQPGFYTADQVQLAVAFTAQAAVAIENSRLYSETLARVTELSQLYTAAQDIGASLEPRIVLEQLAQHLVKILDATSGYINSYTPSRQELTVLAENWSASALPTERKSDLGQSYILTEHPVAARVIEQRAVINILPDTPGLAAAERAQFSEYDVQSILIVPIFSKGQVLGTAEIWDSRWPREFTVSEKRLAQTLVQQAAGVIESARLYQELAAEKQRLELIYRLSRTLSERLDPEQVYAAIHRAAAELMPCEAFVIGLLDESRQEINLVYLVDRGVRSPAARIPVARGLSGATIAKRAPIRIDDSAEVNDLDWVRFGGKEIVRSMLSVPILLGTRTIGSISAQSYQADAYTAKDEQTLSTLTYQAAVAIENARLYNEAQRRLADQTLLYECSQKLSLANDIPSIIAAVAEPILARLRATDLCYFTYNSATDSIRFDYDAWSSEATERERVSAVGDVIVLSGLYPKIDAVLRLHLPQVIRGQDQDLSPTERELLADYGGRTILFIPLIVQDQVIGCFEIWNSQSDRDYDEDEIQLLISLANQTATRLQNVHLLEEILRRADETLSLYEIGVAASSGLDPDKVLSHIYEQISRVIEAPYFLATAFDETKDELRVEFYVENGRRRSFESSVLNLDATWSPPVYWIIRQRQPLCLPDLWDPPAQFMALAKEIRGNTRAYLGVPLIARGRVIGALTLQHERPGVYSDRESALLMTIANQAAAAIENSRLLDETRRRDAILGALADISEQLLMPGKLDDAIPGILAQLGQAANVSRVYLVENELHSDETVSARQRFEWCAPHTGSQIDRAGLQNFHYSERSLTMMPKGQSIFGLTRDFPTDERLLLESQNILSIMEVPIFSGDTWWGILGFADCLQERAWLSAEREALKSVAGALGAAIIRQKIEAAERRQRTFNEALRDTAAALSGTLNFDEVLDRILANVGRVVPHDVADVMLLDDGIARPMRWRGYAERGLEHWIKTLRMPLKDFNTLRRMAESSQPFIIADAWNEPSWIPRPESKWVRSYAGAPIHSKDQIIGFINLGSATPGAFTQEHVEGLQTFAEQAAVAIQNAQLYDSLNTLYHSSAYLINPGGNVLSVAEQIAETLVDNFKFAHCSVLLLDETETELKRLVRAGVLQQTTLATIPLDGPGLIALAVSKGHPLYVSDVLSESRYVAGNVNTRSEFVVPLHSGSKIIGVLDLQSAEPNGFDEHTRRIVSLFAESAALAIENAQLLERLDQAREAAENANRLKSEFLANTSHELRTPLTGIIGSLSMVVDRLCDNREEEQEFSRIAYLASQRLLTIINDVLDIAKIEAGRMKAAAQVVALEALLDEIAEASRLQADGKHLFLEVGPLPPEAFKVWADPNKLRQVLSNLIGNAIKFTERGGVTVQASVIKPVSEAAETLVEILVKDTGIGIPLDKQELLFQPFVQVDGSLTRKYSGTGLGLSISRHLTELMGGTLSCYSGGEDQGAEFRVRLPVANEDQSHVV